MGNQWVILIALYLCLQLPLGMLVGDFFAAGEDLPEARSSRE
jgi:hypothetical protein